jgi:hypothetical protein
VPAGVVGHGADRETTDPAQEQELAEGPRRLLVVVQSGHAPHPDVGARMTAESGNARPGAGGRRRGPEMETRSLTQHGQLALPSMKDANKKRKRHLGRARRDSNLA